MLGREFSTESPGRNAEVEQRAPCTTSGAKIGLTPYGNDRALLPLSWESLSFCKIAYFSSQ